MEKIHILSAELKLKRTNYGRWYIVTNKGDVDIEHLNVEQLNNLLKVDVDSDFTEYVQNRITSLTSAKDIVSNFIDTLETVKVFKPITRSEEDRRVDFVKTLSGAIVGHFSKTGNRSVTVTGIGSKDGFSIVDHGSFYTTTPLRQFEVSFMSSSVEDAVYSYFEYRGRVNIKLGFTVDDVDYEFPTK